MSGANDWALALVALRPGGGGGTLLAADFTASPTSGPAPLDVPFTDLSTGAPTSWAWTFGDGATSTERNPVHEYAAGSYTVALTVSRASESDTITKTAYITVTSGSGTTTTTILPAADAYVKSTSANTNFGTASTLRVKHDPSPSKTSLHSYLRFGVGGVLGPVTSVKLRLFVTDASDAGGCVHSVPTAWAESGLTWSNAPDISDPSVACHGATVAGTWAEFTLPAESVPAGATEVAFALQSTSTNSVFYSSRETASDPQLVVTWQNGPPPPPAADFSASPTSGSAPLDVTFTDLSTGSPSAWSWDFGDGGISTQRNPVHRYEQPGLFSVTLTITTGQGDVSTTKADHVQVTAPGSAPVIAAAGDIACDPSDVSFNGGSGTATACRQLATSDLLVGAGLAAVLPLGDLQYHCGGATAFAASYDLSWGRVKAITRPAPGNHEYQSAGGTGCDTTGTAAGYYAYFGSAAGDPAKGYYSFDIGAWHLIALNSECGKVQGCGPGSLQEQWLRADLAAHENACTLAYWHKPLFSSGEHRGTSDVRPLWQALYDFDADVVLSGHDHDYERFAPQTATGVADPVRGIREFVVGTGGRHLRVFGAVAANSQVRDSTSFGVLRLTLRSNGYDWAFVPAAGSTFTDSGSASCH